MDRKKISANQQQKILGSFSLALEKGERERGGEEKGEKRREKEKRKGKDYEVMGRAPATF